MIFFLIHIFFCNHLRMLKKTFIRKLNLFRFHLSHLKSNVKYQRLDLYSYLLNLTIDITSSKTKSSALCDLIIILFLPVSPSTDTVPLLDLYRQRKHSVIENQPEVSLSTI